ncbi:MAG: MATE family efflux transporter [Halanaerobiales bacterium]|nr:MATE family efflux transporter [Halanaerobiales bacterium]
MIGMMVNALYNLVDTIFIGQGAGTMAIAGIAIAFPIQMLIMAIAQTVGIGSASIISRNLGAGDQRKAEETAGTSFTTVVFLSILFTIFGSIFLNPMLRLFGATDTILPYASQYMSIILLGSVFFSFAMSSNSLVRSEGNAKVAMFSMIIGTGLNIILDPIFIFGFNMGIRGAAIATVLSQIVSFIYLLAYFLSGKSMLKIRKKDLIPNFSLVIETFTIGGATFARTIAGSIVSIVINKSIIYYGTDLHIAILGVGNRVLMFMLMPLFGIVQGLQPIVGFNYGAKNMKRVKESLKLATIGATAMSTFSYVLLMLLTKPIFRLFTKDQSLILEGVPILRILVLVLPVIGFQIIAASLFQAIGKAVPALILTMSRQILFLIPAVLILPRFIGLDGVWYAFPLSDVLATVVTCIWLVKEIRFLNQHPISEQEKLQFALEGNLK